MNWKLTGQVAIASGDADSGNGPYMYDEHRYGCVPTQEAAQTILANLKSGRAFPHPISEPGFMERLDELAAGRPVDPSYWLGIPQDAQGWHQLDAINKEHFYVDAHPLCSWKFKVDVAQPKLRCERCTAVHEAQTKQS
jgi:hypothetical protein